MSITNRERFMVDPSLLQFVLERKKIEVQDDVDSLDMDLFLENLVRLAKKKWKDAGSHTKSMESKFGYSGGWLEQEAKIPELKPKKPKMRKTKDFSELSKRSKDRETAELRGSNDMAKLLHAA